MVRHHHVLGSRALMAFDAGQQSAIFPSLISAAIVVGAGVAVHRRRGWLSVDSTV